MYSSIENRTPYLTKDLFDFSFSIPDKFLIYNGYGKYILREAFKDIIPSEIINQREKIGFNCNVKDLFDTESQDFKNIIFSSNFINNQISVDKINKLLNKDEITNVESHLIFSILSLATFFNVFK